MNKQECARLETLDGQQVVLKSVRAKGTVRGLIFEASVEQRFANPTDRNIEVVYTFPLPWGAVLLGVDVKLGDKQLFGTVVEKIAAEAKYEEALGDGDAAIMLEKNHDLSYCLNLGNLAAQEECVITLRYAQTLQFEQGGLRLLIPTVICPRYGDAMADGGLQPHQVPEHSLCVEYPFEIELRLHGDLARARVASPSHPVRTAYAEDETGGVLTVTLAREGALDRDFVLIVDRLAHDSVAVLARDPVKPGSVVALASFCPRMAVQGPTTIGVKILVDCSGSMGGDSIAAARRALQEIVKQLEDGDRFSLSRFGSTVEHRSRGLWTVTKVTQVAAKRWVRGLKADLGGTEMESALVSTFALAKGVRSDVLLVTDGEISAIDQVIESAQAAGHRLFIVGIGSSPAESHLRRLSDATGGACDFVAPGEAVEPAVLRMFARLRSPRFTELNLAWPEGAVPDWATPLHGSVFNGDTVNVFASLGQAPKGNVRLLGLRAGGSQAEEIGSACIDEAIIESDTLARMAAMARVVSMSEDRSLDRALDPAEIAIQYQLVTEKTNFLLVHKRAEEDKPKDMPDLHKIRQMVAAGWGGTGSVMFSRTGMTIFETRVDGYRLSAALDWSDHDAAAPIERVVHSVPVKASRSRSGSPKFLRKDDPIIDRSNPRYWSKSEEYSGMTPLGLSEWLRLTPTDQWPTTYAELMHAGLGAWVVDWLELAVGTCGGMPIPEHTVVEAFVYAMSQRNTHEALSNSVGLKPVFQRIGERLRSLLASGTTAGPSSVDVGLVEEIMALLVGMTAVRWPDQVFALEMAEQGASDGRERAATLRRH